MSRHVFIVKVKSAAVMCLVASLGYMSGQKTTNI